MEIKVDSVLEWINSILFRLMLHHYLMRTKRSDAKLYIPSTLNIDLILWQTQLIVCAENVKSWVFPLTFQGYILPHTYLNFIFEF